jgi:chorismate synthase
MSGNSFGTHFKVTTFGESHGRGVGVVVDGVTPLIEISERDIQKELDRRKPGQSHITTARKESDTIHILSGVFEGKTTGTPLAMILYNQDHDSRAYDHIQHAFRPGHADFTYQAKYGIRDYRGSGRASGRETAGRVAAGAVAKKILATRGIRISAYTVKAAGIECSLRDMAHIEENPMRACDPQAAEKMVQRIEDLKEKGDSAGGVVECLVEGLPKGIGEPVFDKFEAEIGKAILSIGAIRGIEIGSGFSAADMFGSSHNDPITPAGFVGNNSGGTLGGITTGEPFVFRAAVKPTASISSEQQTINDKGEPITIRTEGRHDPCICPRIVPVIEAMCAIVIVDMLKRQAALLT